MCFCACWLSAAVSHFYRETQGAAREFSLSIGQLAGNLTVERKNKIFCYSKQLAVDRT
jgi:hypothetical protein